jgi:superfamily II DNA helicase RecQ
MNTALSPNTIEKLMALQAQFQQIMVLQLLLEWPGEPTLPEIETAFSSITNTPLSSVTLPSLLKKQWVEQPHPQAPFGLTLLGLKTLKQFQKTLSHSHLQVKIPNVLEQEALKPTSISAVEENVALVPAQKPAKLPTPPAFLIRTPKPASTEETTFKEPTKPVAETLSIPTEEALDEAHWAFYETLREARWHLAQKEAVKPYRICSNAVLRSLAVHQPTDYPALEKLSGIGKVFIEKYAPTFISLSSANVLK